MLVNIASFLYRTALLYPDKVAVKVADAELSFATVLEMSQKVASGLLALGVKPGDCVALSCPNILQFISIYYGILTIGAVVCPVNILLSAAGVCYQLKDCAAKVYFCFEGSVDFPLGTIGLEGFKKAVNCAHFIAITADPNSMKWGEHTTFAKLVSDNQPIDHLAQCDSDETAVILYTSGTTGAPKGAMLTHANLSMNLLSCIGLLKSDSRDVYLVVLPMFHSFAQTTQMLRAVAVGAKLILHPRFDARAVLDSFLKESVTIFAGVPTIYIGLNQALNNLSEEDIYRISIQLRICLSGGDALPKAVFEEFENKLQVSILEGYGLSETSPVAFFNSLDAKPVPGSIGRPIAGVLARIVNEAGKNLQEGEIGELILQGHNVMKGYVNHPELTKKAIKNGWFYTGDLAKYDSSGNFFIIDRLTDVIIRGGFNVYPKEIEDVLLTHSQIMMVAVIGVKDPYYIEEIMACVVLKKGQSLAETDLIEWSRQLLGEYKYPRHVKFFDSLPLNSTGKILKKELRAQLNT